MVALCVNPRKYNCAREASLTALFGIFALTFKGIKVMAQSCAPTIEQIKAGAKAIKSTLKNRFNIQVNHTQTLELSAVAYGYKDWHVASSLLQNVKKKNVKVMKVDASPNKRFFLISESMDIKQWSDTQVNRRIAQSRIQKKRAKALETNEDVEEILDILSITSEELENIPEHVYVGKDFVNIVFDKSDEVIDYEIDLNALQNETELLLFVKHLAGKVWMSEKILYEFMIKAGIR